MTKVDIKKLSKILSYEIKNQDSFLQALRHRSVGGAHNERLEFLGDSVLNLVITKALYHHFRHAPEGVLTRLRAGLVKGETLADMATEMGINEFLLLGQGERQSGGFRRRSILADTLEAIIGAIYVESGFEEIERVLLSWYENRINHLEVDSYQKDPKTQLQEYCQARKLALPKYEVVKTTGEPHDQTFSVHCTVAALKLESTGEGKSRRVAEQVCAQIIIQSLDLQTKDKK